MCSAAQEYRRHIPPGRYDWVGKCLSTSFNLARDNRASSWLAGAFDSSPCCGVELATRTPDGYPAVSNRTPECKHGSLTSHLGTHDRNFANGGYRAKVIHSTPHEMRDVGARGWDDSVYGEAAVEPRAS